MFWYYVFTLLFMMPEQYQLEEVIGMFCDSVKTKNKRAIRIDFALFSLEGVM